MVTLKDIAKLSGYSVTTVSRALNGYSDVNEETRQHIQNIADQHGYAPNVLAKGLVSQDSKTFGFITSHFSQTKTPLIDNFTFSLFIRSIEKANALGYDIVLIHYNEKLQKNKTFKQLIAERNLSGAIIQGFDRDDELCQDALNSKVPTVFIDMGLDNESSGFVVSNIRKAAKMGFEYLVDCGYRNLLFIFGSEESWVTDQWKEAVAEASQQYQGVLDSIASLNGNYSLEDTIDLIVDNQAMVQKEKLAIFCASDHMAVGAIKGLEKLQIKVPDQTGVLGYDGMVISQYLTPSLSTIAQNPEELSAKAVEMLLEIMNNKQKRASYICKEVEVELIIRESTKELKHD